MGSLHRRLAYCIAALLGMLTPLFRGSRNKRESRDKIDADASCVI